MRAREVMRVLEREGWRQGRKGGSHRQFQHPDRAGTVTVAGGLGDGIPRGRPASIWRQAPSGAAMTGYPVVIEHEGDAWGAYVPDLPGCAATARSRAEVERRIREAVPAHVTPMRQAGEQVPELTVEGGPRRPGILSPELSNRP